MEEDGLGTIDSRIHSTVYMPIDTSMLDGWMLVGGHTCLEEQRTLRHLCLLPPPSVYMCI